MNTPIGVSVKEIPPGAEKVVVGGTTYFLANGIYFQPVFQDGVTVYVTAKV